MTHDEIIAISIRAGLEETCTNEIVGDKEYFFRFAKLIAARERERCELLIEQITGMRVSFNNAYDYLAELQAPRQRGDV